VIALNKLDLISGWRNTGDNSLSNEIRKQDQITQRILDEKIYGVVGSLSRLGYTSEAFWRVKDFTREVAVVPVSAATGRGIPELLVVLIGLTQQYLGQKLERHDGPARGIVLEVNEEIGLGPSANIIILDGILKQGASIIVAKRDASIVTKAKALLVPKPLDEMRDPRDKFMPVTEVAAAAGLKITSPDLEGVLAGSPIYVLEKKEDEARLKTMLHSEVNAAFINTESNGVTLKCDTIGSIEAITDMLNKANVAIQSADIGYITRRDVIAASAVKEKDRYLGVILGFNVRILEDALREAQERDVKIFNEQIIYNLVRSYVDWAKYQKEHEESIVFNEISPICKFQFMKGFIFRRNSPAVFGAEILVGKLRQKVRVINDSGKKIGTVHQIQDSGKTINEATTGMQVAISIREPTIGRQINEGDFFYTDLNSRNAKMLIERFAYRLTNEEKDVFEAILLIKRKDDPAFGYL
jgi:translation initiation factor 5B